MVGEEILSIAPDGDRPWIIQPGKASADLPDQGELDKIEADILDLYPL